MCSRDLGSMTLLAAGKKSTSLVSLIDPFGELMDLHRWFYACSCVQIRNWFDYRNHICIVSTYASRRLYFSCFWWSGYDIGLMISSGIWEAWAKPIWLSAKEQLPFISYWPCSRICQTNIRVCCMWVLSLLCNHQVFWISNNIIRILNCYGLAWSC